jgi:hypothetical protein
VLSSAVSRSATLALLAPLVLLAIHHLRVRLAIHWLSLAPVATSMATCFLGGTTNKRASLGVTIIGSSSLLFFWGKLRA